MGRDRRPPRAHSRGTTGQAWAGWQEPAGDRGRSRGPPGADGRPGSGWRPAGEGSRNGLHHSGGVTVRHAAVIHPPSRRFMDHLTFPACSLFITCTCNDELKILLHEARLYCLMGPCRKPAVNSCLPSCQPTFPGSQAAGLGTVPPGHGPSIYPQDSLATGCRCSGHPGEWGLAPSVCWPEPCAHSLHLTGMGPGKTRPRTRPALVSRRTVQWGLAHIPHDAETQDSELPATWEMSCIEPQPRLSAFS